MTPEIYYLIWVAAYLLCGIGFYIGVSRLLSRKIKKKTAQQVALLASMVLVSIGLFMATMTYILIQKVLCYGSTSV